MVLKSFFLINEYTIYNYKKHVLVVYLQFLTVLNFIINITKNSTLHKNFRYLHCTFFFLQPSYFIYSNMLKLLVLFFIIKAWMVQIWNTIFRVIKGKQFLFNHTKMIIINVKQFEPFFFFCSWNVNYFNNSFRCSCLQNRQHKQVPTYARHHFSIRNVFIIYSINMWKGGYMTI